MTDPVVPAHSSPTPSVTRTDTPEQPPAVPTRTRPTPPSQDPAARQRAQQADSFWAQIGGTPTFSKIVHRFYQQVAEDPLMREMYPEEDLAPAEDRLRMFLEQYWGGPTTYSETRGHPRLRMRHQPFDVTPTARDRWLAAMRVGVKEAKLSPIHEATLWDYLERAAHSLVNTFEEGAR